MLTIENDEQLSRALLVIEEFWGAEQGTAKGDQLDRYFAAVLEYELLHHPVPAPD